MDVRRNKICRGGNKIMKDHELKRNASGAYGKPPSPLRKASWKGAEPRT